MQGYREAYPQVGMTFVAPLDGELGKRVGIAEESICRGISKVCAMLADARNNLMGNPALERFRFRLAGAKNQTI